MCAHLQATENTNNKYLSYKSSQILMKDVQAMEKHEACRSLQELLSRASRNNCELSGFLAGTQTIREGGKEEEVKQGSISCLYNISGDSKGKRLRQPTQHNRHGHFGPLAAGRPGSHQTCPGTHLRTCFKGML